MNTLDDDKRRARAAVDDHFKALADAITQPALNMGDFIPQRVRRERSAQVKITMRIDIRNRLQHHADRFGLSKPAVIEMMINYLDAHEQRDCDTFVPVP